MARENWKCPHTDCNGESTRRWNCGRHIKNLHHCGCSPVKVKPSNVIRQSRIEDTQFKRNTSRVQDSFHSKGNLSYESMRGSNSLNSYHQYKNNDVIEGNTQKHGGTTSNEDPIDVLYQAFKGAKERNDKILEMRNYFKTYGLDFRFPIFSPVNIFDNSAANTIFPPNISPDYSTHSLLKSGFSPPSLSITNKIIGYEIHNCEVCLESESLPVMCDSNAGNVFKSKHVCEPDKVNTVRKYPRFAKGDICFYNILSSSDRLLKTVKEWSRGRLPYLVSSRVLSRENPLGTIDLKIKENQYSWLIRAIKQECTILNESELKEFFTLTEDVTFCCLSITFVQAQQNIVKESFYFFLNYKPCVPFEN